MFNIHINLNEFTNASRVLKQVNSLIKLGIFKKIIIIALWAESLERYEIISPGIEIYRIKLISRGLPKNFLFQGIKYIEFFIKVLFLLIKFRPSVVNAHAFSVLPIACIFKKMCKCHLVYDAHELETEQSGGKSFRKKISKLIERKFINCYDLMIVVSEGIADWYEKEYNIKRPLVILNAPSKRDLLKKNNFREKFGIEDFQIIVLYQGLLSVGRGVHWILEAFKARENNNVVAVFMGYGELQKEIQSTAAEFGNIYFHPAVPPKNVLEYTSSADLGISLIEKTCLSYYYCMPNKLFEYAMAGLPVMVSNMKDMSEFVIQNNMGVVIEDFSIRGINDAIDNFLQQDLSIIKNNAYRAACDNAWEVQEKKMLQAYRVMLD